MRTIKFRGLTANNEWVYGDLTHDAPNETAYFKDFSQRIHWVNEQGQRCNQPVKNGTVGQFIGLNDKDNREIYEGDILMHEDFTNRKHKVLGVVKWEETDAAFTKFYPLHKFAVVGNVHDNPEPLQAQG